MFGAAARRAARRVFGLLLHVLPVELRRRAASGMHEVFDARTAEARGVVALARAWLHEFAGLARVAFTSRLPDPWLAEARSGRTVEGSGAAQSMGASGRPLEGFVQDLRFTFRAASRSRGAWALAWLTCALGIGASTAMFSVADAVLWRPLPYPDPGRVVMVYPTIPEWRGDPTLGGIWMRGSWSYPEYADWAAQQTVFEEAAVYGRSTATLTGGGEPLQISIGRSSPTLFAVLGARPVIGRVFTGEAGESDAQPQAVLTHALWQSRFGGAADVIGQDLELSGRARTIVGVLPATFTLAGLAADVWLPIEGSERQNRNDHNLRMIARLGRGVTMARAQQETGRLLGALSEGHSIRHGAFLVSRLEDETRQVRTPLTILLAAALLLLLVACVNVAALVLGMGIDREQEILVRGAIGAGRGRLVRQLLTENVVLALLGGLAGMLLATVLARALVLLAPSGIPRLDQVAISARVLAFATFTTAVVGMGIGLLPAFALTGVNVAARLRGTRVVAGRGRLHGALVVAQLSLACVLLVGAGLLTRTLIRLDRVDPGFDPDGILGVRVAPDVRQFVVAGAFSPQLYTRWFDDVREAIASVRGVVDVAITDVLPYSGDRGSNDVWPADRPAPSADSINAERTAASSNYMDVVRMRRLEGRFFHPADQQADAAPVVIINEALARRFWPGESAVGKRLGYWDRVATVVGVVANTRDRSLDIGTDLRYYIPAGPGRGGSFVLRVAPALEPASIVAAVRERVWSVDPSVPITSTLTLRQRVEDSLAEQRFRARLMLAFGAFAALFAALGIHGVTSRSVAARTREIGIRMALGEQPRGVVRLVLGQGLRLAVAGAVLGTLGGIAASRALAGFLYETRTFDPLTLALVAAALAALALAASLVPSMRAARVDPVVALRSD